MSRKESPGTVPPWDDNSLETARNPDKSIGISDRNHFGQAQKQSGELCVIPSEVFCSACAVLEVLQQSEGAQKRDGIAFDTPAGEDSVLWLPALRLPSDTNVNRCSIKEAWSQT